VKCLVLAALLASTTPAPPTAPPSPDAFAAAVDKEVTGLEAQVAGLAEAMPEAKFDFTPEGLRLPDGDFHGVRTFAAQVRHVAADNFAIWAPLTGEPEPPGIDAPNGPARMTSRAEILKFLRDSFVYAHRAAALLTSQNALETVEFRGQRVTRLSLVALALTHAMDHYGQMVVYLRMCGLTPPASRPRPKPTAAPAGRS
jgi:uncharacterized damage-inducible protein DinB